MKPKIKKNPFGKSKKKATPQHKNPRFVRPDDRTLHFWAMWNDLHEYAQWYPAEPDIRRILMAKKWLKKWAKRFPDDCPCREEWEAAIRFCPPPLEGGKSEFFWWTIALHDRINVKLGKKVWAARSKKHKLLQNVDDPENRLRTPSSNTPF